MFWYVPFLVALSVVAWLVLRRVPVQATFREQLDIFKYIPEYFPKDVGAVGGLVGLLGALGGFFLPPLFAYAYKGTGIPQTTFAILFLITLVSFAWLHWVVYRIMRQATPHLRDQFEMRK